MSSLSKFVTVVVLVFVAGCASLTREKPPELSCSGPIDGDTNDGYLLERFGGENVRDGEVDIGEGEIVRGTILYPDDPSRRVEITWKDPALKSHVETVRVSEPSRWVVGGLTTGLDLRSVERLNERPFSLYGFEWDYAGTIASWNGGALDGGGDCRLLARFRPPEDRVSEQDLSGEELFGSDDPRMRELNPSIYEILLIFD